MEPTNPANNNADDDAAEVDEIASVFLEDLHPECWAAEATRVKLVCPLALFGAWFSVQPAQVREFIGYNVAGFAAADAIYRGLPRKLRCPVRCLEAWLEISSPTPVQLLARVAVLRQALDLGVFRNRSTCDDWRALSSEAVDYLLAAKQQQDQRAVTICEKGLEGLPARAALWIESARSWRQLCASVLSEDALACWLEIASWQQD